MAALQVALVLPHRGHLRDEERGFRFSELREACGAGQVDLVVFPEAFKETQTGGVRGPAEAMARRLGVPVLMGVAADDGEGWFETAVYHDPGPGETASHLYVKHSTSGKVAFEWPGYAREQAAMFRPIVLKGRRIGVQVCHDMYFGLIGQRLVREGAEILVDLTFGNVNLKKWSNVLRGRSLDLRVPFLCTMQWDPETPSGHSDTLVYAAGRRLKYTRSAYRSDGEGWFDVYDIGGASEVVEEDDGQTYATTKKREITLALGTGQAADVRFTARGTGLDVSGREWRSPSPGWRAFRTTAGTVGVLTLPLADLWDGLAIYRAGVPDGSFVHHLVAYSDSATPRDRQDVMALAKLRAIEHRVGVVVYAGEVREVIKTNRFKNIQRFRCESGLFGLDAAWLGGTRSALAGYKIQGAWQGIPPRFVDAYLALQEP